MPPRKSSWSVRRRFRQVPTFLAFLVLGSVLAGCAGSKLMKAARQGNQEIVNSLIAKGTPLDIVDFHGRTPLHMAVLGGEANVVKALIDAGANVNARDGGGRTPLYLASAAGGYEIARALLLSGANPEIADNRGRSAADAVCSRPSPGAPCRADEMGRVLALWRPSPSDKPDDFLELSRLGFSRLTAEDQSRLKRGSSSGPPGKDRWRFPRRRTWAPARGPTPTP